MQVIGAGFSRTGTLSLKVALEELGSDPCYHMIELMEHPEHAGMWERATRGEPVDFEDVFAEYEATTDLPSALFWRELAQAYPEAKVLLTVRDPERWYDSASQTIFNLKGIKLNQLLMRAASPVMPEAGAFKRMGDNVLNLTKLPFDGRFEDKAHAISVFERHNEEVKAGVPAEKLLVYEVKEGWGTLCEFLGVEVPQKPFPHLNESQNFEEVMYPYRRRLLLRVGAASAALALPISIGLIGLLWLGRRALRR